MKIRIGDVVFASKEAAKKRVRDILYAYGVGSKLDAQDSAFLFELLQNHPEVDQKIGCGVACFSVEQNMGSIGFWLTRHDGSRTDFSFLSCLTAPTHTVQVKRALRHEIREQIWAFRDNTFSKISGFECPITGFPITRVNAHIDHVLPFEEIVAGFLAAYGHTFSTIAVKPTTDGSTDTEMIDPETCRQWRVFHAQTAVLRAVSPQANLSLLRRAPKLRTAVEVEQ